MLITINKLHVLNGYFLYFKLMFRCDNKMCIYIPRKLYFKNKNYSMYLADKLENGGKYLDLARN